MVKKKGKFSRQWIKYLQLTGKKDGWEHSHIIISLCCFPNTVGHSTLVCFWCKRDSGELHSSYVSFSISPFQLSKILWIIGFIATCRNTSNCVWIKGILGPVSFFPSKLCIHNFCIQKFPRLKAIILQREFIMLLNKKKKNHHRGFQYYLPIIFIMELKCCIPWLLL